MAPATFRSTAYPALVFVTDSGRHKFVGGRLTVEGDTIEEVEAFAAARPHYGITREDAPEATETTEEPENGTVDATLAEVGDDPEKARVALERERAGKNRKTLVTALEEVIAEAEANAPMAADEMQAVFDQALEEGILEEAASAEEALADGVVRVAIEERDGERVLVQTVQGE